MLIEILVFVAMLLLFYAGTQIWSLVSRVRARIRGRRIDAMVKSMDGQRIQDAEKLFGPPLEVVDGTTGRQLYIWKSPPSEQFPPGPGLLIVTLTVDSHGWITHAVWKAR